MALLEAYSECRASPGFQGPESANRALAAFQFRRRQRRSSTLEDVRSAHCFGHRAVGLRAVRVLPEELSRGIEQRDQAIAVGNRLSSRLPLPGARLDPYSSSMCSVAPSIRQSVRNGPVGLTFVSFSILVVMGYRFGGYRISQLIARLDDWPASGAGETRAAQWRGRPGHRLATNNTHGTAT